jgi:hypothetical protein
MIIRYRSMITNSIERVSPMNWTSSPSFLAILTLCVTATGCPPFDKGRDENDGGAISGDGSSTNWSGSPGGGPHSDGGRTSGAGAGLGGAGSGSTGGLGSGSTGGPGTGDDPFGTNGGGGDTGFGGGGFGSDPFGTTGGGGDTGSGNPDDLLGGTGGTGGGGSAGSVGSGHFGGNSGTDGPNAPADARLSRWSGRWNGQMTYHVPVQDGGNVLTGPDVKWVPRTMDMAMRIDALDYDPNTGYASLTAKIAVADCLLTSDLTGTIFFGDDLSPTINPILALQAAGANKTGQFLALRLNAERAFNVVSGTMNFQGVDSLKFPCSEKDLAFRFDRVLPTAN